MVAEARSRNRLKAMGIKEINKDNKEIVDAPGGRRGSMAIVCRGVIRDHSPHGHQETMPVCHCLPRTIEVEEGQGGLSA